MFKECLAQRIEVTTGEQKRRRYTPQEKARFVALAMQPGYTVSLVAAICITPSLFKVETADERWWRVCNCRRRRGGQCLRGQSSGETKSNSFNKCWDAKRWKPKSFGTRLR
ncbi:transposase [Lonsdalea quercina]|uniref:transposase n=1 Tax=Lonsdalea quercina TaxID=71657 RepID=UPI0039758D2B